MTAPSTHLTTCGFCGALCQACPLYLGSTEEPASLAAFAQRSGKSLEEVTCHGCRSEVLSGYCRTCKLRTCAQAKGVAFCADCAEFPCADLRAFAAKSSLDPGRVMADGQAIREQGWEAWRRAKAADYACPSCGTINSVYELECRKCGHDPSNAFVGRHREAIIRQVSGSK
jgi:hypothetical protein